MPGVHTTFVDAFNYRVWRIIAAWLLWVTNLTTVRLSVEESSGGGELETGSGGGSRQMEDQWGQ